MLERLKKLNDLLRDEVGKLLTSEVDQEDGVLVTVVSADTSPTLEHATIKLSVFPQARADIIIKKIEKRIYHIQQILNKRLSMRPVPKIRFEIDTSEKHRERIEKILNHL